MSYPPLVICIFYFRTPLDACAGVVISIRGEADDTPHCGGKKPKNTNASPDAIFRDLKSVNNFSCYHKPVLCLLNHYMACK